MAGDKNALDVKTDGNALVRLAAFHAEIRRHCARLEQYVRYRYSSSVRWRRAPSIQRTIDFIDVDINRHHLIEDTVLFPHLLALPLTPTDRVPLVALIAALRDDHRQLDLLWTAIKPALTVAAHGGVLVAGVDMTTFVTSYRHHMKREDAGIFPFALRHLDSSALQAIAAAMDAGRGERKRGPTMCH